MNSVVKADEVPSGWSPEAANIINGLICRKEEDRLGKLGVKSVMAHPWFKSINWKDLKNKTIEAPFIPNNVKSIISFRLTNFSMRPTSNLLRKVLNYLKI